MRKGLVAGLLCVHLTAYSQIAEIKVDEKKIAVNEISCGYERANVAILIGKSVESQGHLLLKLKNFRTVLDNASDPSLLRFSVDHESVGEAELVIHGQSYRLERALKSQCAIAVNAQKLPVISFSVSCKGMAPVKVGTLLEKEQQKLGSVVLSGETFCRIQNDDRS